MKKIIVCFSLAAVLLSGCGGGKDRSLYPKPMSAEGEITAVEYKPGNIYTHTIATVGEDGVAVDLPAKSQVISLNKYNDRIVEASGMLELAQDDETEILDIDKIKMVVSLNEEFTDFDEIGRGFVVEYPKVLEVMPSQNVIDFALINDVIYRIEVLPANTTNLEIAVAGERGVLAEDMYSEKEIEVADVPAIFERRKTDDDTEMRKVYILGGENFYVISYLGGDEENAAIWEKLFEKMYLSFVADDLDAGILTKSCSALMSSIPCDEGQVCMVNTDGVNGACVADDIAQKDIKIISETCNNSQGFVIRSEFDCVVGDEGCLFATLPSCNCGSGRVWDDLQGCIAGAQVSPAVLDPVVDPVVSKPVVPTEPSVVPEESREMISEPWDYKLFYPKNWYYTGLGGGSYLFSESSNPEKMPAVLVSLDENCVQDSDTDCVSSGMQTFAVKTYSSKYDAEGKSIGDSIVSSK